MTCARSLRHLERTSGFCPASSPGSTPLVSRPPAQAPPASHRMQAGRDGRSSPRRQAEEGGGQRAEASAGPGVSDCSSARVVSASSGRERHRRGSRTSRPVEVEGHVIVIRKALGICNAPPPRSVQPVRHPSTSVPFVRAQSQRDGSSCFGFSFKTIRCFVQHLALLSPRQYI